MSVKRVQTPDQVIVAGRDDLPREEVTVVAGQDSPVVTVSRDAVAPNPDLQAWNVLFQAYHADPNKTTLEHLVKFIVAHSDDVPLMNQIIDEFLEHHNGYASIILYNIGASRLSRIVYRNESISNWLELYAALMERPVSGGGIAENVAKSFMPECACAHLAALKVLYKENADPIQRFAILRLAVDWWSVAQRRYDFAIVKDFKKELENLVRVSLKDPDCYCRTMSWFLAEKLGWEAESLSRAMPIGLRPAVNEGSLEFGLPFYLEFSNPMRQIAWTYLSDSLGHGTKRAVLALGDLRPIHSLADYNPDPAKRAPVLAAKLERLEKILKEKGHGRDVLEEYLYGDDSTHHNPNVLVVEIPNQSGQPEFFVTQGHHRLAALHVAAERGLIGDDWLSHIPVSLQVNQRFPNRLARHILTDGYRFGWKDLIPKEPKLSTGSTGRRGRKIGGLAGARQRPPALWRPELHRM